MLRKAGFTQRINNTKVESLKQISKCEFSCIRILLL